MSLSFNTAGPCFPDEHYMLPPEARLGRVLELIDKGKYFTLRAGRQTGKTTSAMWLVKHFNAGERFRCLWLDVQTAREQPDTAQAVRTLLKNLDMAVARSLPDLGPPADRDELLSDPETAFLRYVRDLSARSRKPLVLLIDEADGLVGPAMVSFLTQLRQGYIDRREVPFPHSLALLGMRDACDDVLTRGGRSEIPWLGTMSPFHLAAEGTILVPLSCEDVMALLDQHTAATGQRFERQATTLVHHLSQGQPSLVNALASIAVEQLVRDRSIAITAEHVETAKETILRKRRRHLGHVTEHLRVPRLRRILESMLVGKHLVQDGLDDDFSYVLSSSFAPGPSRATGPG